MVNLMVTLLGLNYCMTEYCHIRFLYVHPIASGAPTATMLTYNDTTRSLTCTSTGGPATTVTWRKNGTVLTINATYQQTQVVTNSSTGTYETVLTISQSVTDISGIYSCTIENTRGTSALEGTGKDLHCIPMQR